MKAESRREAKRTVNQTVRRREAPRKVLSNSYDDHGENIPPNGVSFRPWACRKKKNGGGREIPHNVINRLL